MSLKYFSQPLCAIVNLFDGKMFPCMLKKKLPLHYKYVIYYKWLCFHVYYRRCWFLCVDVLFKLRIDFYISWKKPALCNCVKLFSKNASTRRLTKQSRKTNQSSENNPCNLWSFERNVAVSKQDCILDIRLVLCCNFDSKNIHLYLFIVTDVCAEAGTTVNAKTPKKIEKC